MIIHISQSAIKANANTGSELPVIAVHHDNGETTYHNEFTLPAGSRIVYDPEGQTLDGSVIRVWIECPPPVIDK